MKTQAKNGQQSNEEEFLRKEGLVEEKNQGRKEDKKGRGESEGHFPLRPPISHLAPSSCSIRSGFPWQDLVEPRGINGGDIVKDTLKEEWTVLMTMARKR